MNALPRTLRTVRYLRSGQVWHRLRRKVIRLLPERPFRVPDRPVWRDDLPRHVWQPAGPHGEAEGPAAIEPFLEQLEGGTFHHLDQEAWIGHTQPDWRLAAVSEGRLWTVTLHYHAWAERLAAIVAAEGHRGRGEEWGGRADRLLRHYLSDWIARCDLETPGAAHLAWNAYAVATRIGHWARLWHLLGADGRATWDGLENAFLRSLWKQAAFLERHLEWDLRGNHLMRDALGLAWAGRFFQGEDAKRWLGKGVALGVDQAREQVLPDGGHFERSPMYHLHVMEDIATLAALVEDDPVGVPAREALHAAWQRMAQFAAWVRHPDGGIPLLNDAALNGGLTPAETLARGQALLPPAGEEASNGGAAQTEEGSLRQWGGWQGLRVAGWGGHFQSFGLAVYHDPTWSLFFDVGPVGVDYQPGHAHADTLTIEASYRGRRLIVDPGTYAYDLDDRRRHDRSTAAHNTVTLDGRDSSEVWHIFRVGRRARSLDLHVDTAQRFNVSAAHDGYRFLPGRPRHRRELEIHDGNLHVIDSVEGGGEHDVHAGLLIHPDWQVERTAPRQWRLSCRDRAVTVDVAGPEGLVCDEESALYHPGFGVEHSTCRLAWRWRGPLPVTVRATIADAPPSPRQMADALRARRAAQALSPARECDDPR